MKWISVKDKLPKENELVIICYDTQFKPDLDISKHRIYCRNMSKLISKNWMQYIGNGNWTLFNYPVIYWMEIPEVPKDLYDSNELKQEYAHLIEHDPFIAWQWGIIDMKDLPDKTSCP